MVHLDVKSWMDLYNIRIQSKMMNTYRNTNHNAHIYGHLSRGNIHPSGGNIHPSGGNIHPSGGNIHPSGGNIHPSGGNMQYAKCQLMICLYLY